MDVVVTLGAVIVVVKAVIVDGGAEDVVVGPAVCLGAGDPIDSA